MADSIFTGQTPLVDGDTNPPATTRGLGMRFTVGEPDHQIVSGAAWIPTDGMPTTFLWQVWRTSGTPALLAEVDIHSLPSPPLGAMLAIPIASPVAVSDSDTYVVRTFGSGDAEYPYSYGQTLPVGSGGVVSSDRCMEDLDTASTDPPSTLGSSDWFFFADVYVEPVAASAAGSGNAAATILGTVTAAKVSKASSHTATVAVGTASVRKAIIATGNAAPLPSGTVAASKRIRSAAVSSTSADVTATASKRGQATSATDGIALGAATVKKVAVVSAWCSAAASTAFTAVAVPPANYAVALPRGRWRTGLPGGRWKTGLPQGG